MECPRPHLGDEVLDVALWPLSRSLSSFVNALRTFELSRVDPNGGIRGRCHARSGATSQAAPIGRTGRFTILV